MIGDSDDITRRVKRILPPRWWAWVAPYRDAVLGGLSDATAWCYSWIVYDRLQSRLATATEFNLDLISYDFLRRHLLRKTMDDGTYRRRIKATILQERVTRAGMINAVTTLVGSPPRINEPWNPRDNFAYGCIGAPMYYGRTGRYGSMRYPAQVFLTVTHDNPPLTPKVGGYGQGRFAYGSPYHAYIGRSQEAGFVEQADIADVIQTTKPTGVIVWTHIL